MSLNFIAALYNEEDEITDLLEHVQDYVDGIYLADDGSTDLTRTLIYASPILFANSIHLVTLEHTGLPETVKNAALQTVPDGSWVLMLDADERFARGVLPSIREWLWAPDPEVTHVYFNQLEIIDDNPVRVFQKSKLFKKEAIRFSTGIHEDDQFEGKGIYKETWVVHHRKSSAKQVQREREYLQTYDRLFEEGKIDEERRQWLRGLHHYVT